MRVFITLTEADWPGKRDRPSIAPVGSPKKVARTKARPDTLRERRMMPKSSGLR